MTSFKSENGKLLECLRLSRARSRRPIALNTESNILRAWNARVSISFIFSYQIENWIPGWPPDPPIRQPSGTKRQMVKLDGESSSKKCDRRYNYQFGGPPKFAIFGFRETKLLQRNQDETKLTFGFVFFDLETQTFGCVGLFTALLTGLTTHFSF